MNSGEYSWWRMPQWVLMLPLLLGGPLTVLGQAPADGSSSQVTAQQIAQELQRVRAVRDISCQPSDEVHELVCSSELQKTIWIFTLPGHPAHPALVRRTMTFGNGTIGIDRSGRYAGPKAGYDAWCLQIDELDRRQMKNFGN
jgi:hypothetical protein